jgi:hypothetical protein
MFPGCTLLDLCARQEELLEDAGYLGVRPERCDGVTQRRAQKARTLLAQLALSVALAVEWLWWLRVDG